MNLTDEQIAAIYTKGNLQSHTEGLRAVFKAGQTPLSDEALKELNVIGTLPAAAPVVEELDVIKEMTNAELRAELDSRGVVFASDSDKSDLERMVKAARKKAAATPA